VTIQLYSRLASVGLALCKRVKNNTANEPYVFRVLTVILPV